MKQLPYRFVRSLFRLDVWCHDVEGRITNPHVRILWRIAFYPICELHELVNTL